MRGALVLVMTVVAACGDDDAGPPDAAPEVCVTDLVTGQTFDLDPDGGPGQGYADAVFDGEVVWLVYSRYDNPIFNVFARRIHCDGTPAGDRIAVSTRMYRNDTEPTVAVGGGRAHVVWHADNRVDENNMDIVYRDFDAAGAPLMDVEVDLETTRNGVAVVGNAFYPDVVALPDGSMVISGVRVLEETAALQAFVQRLDASGMLVGEAIDGHIESGVPHHLVSTAIDAEGTVYVSWVRSPSFNEDHVVYAALPDGASGLEPSPPVQIAADSSTSPSYAVHGDRVYLAYDAGGAIGLTDGAALDGTTAALLDDPAREDHMPTVAAAPGGGAVAWYRNISGLENELVAQAFTYDGTSFTLGKEVLVTAGPAQPYSPVLTHIRDDIYFVAWSEGTSPDFYLKGRFMALE